MRVIIDRFFSKKWGSSRASSWKPTTRKVIKRPGGIGDFGYSISAAIRVERTGRSGFKNCEVAGHRFATATGRLAMPRTEYPRAN